MAAISIPDELFQSAESLGKRLRVSRSRLYATALAEFLAKHQGRKITDRLNQVYGTDDGGLDDRLGRMQRGSLYREQW
ncbi:MAG: hypothetical protein R2712_14980 [Vicinamibacterales bacterium]